MALDGEVFDMYLEDISKYPLIEDREEEIELARRAQEGDELARERLVTANLRFVVSYVKNYTREDFDMGRLVSLGNEGLLEAVERFDPERGVKFISYAVWWIRQKILKALNETNIKIPRYTALEYNKAWKRMQQYPEDVSVETAASKAIEETEANISIERFMNVYNSRENRLIRLDAPIADGDEEADDMYSSGIVSHVESAERDVQNGELEKKLDEAIQLVESKFPRDAKALRLYYGLDGEREHTLQEIGDFLGITRERARNLRDRGLKIIGESEYGEVLEFFYETQAK